MNDGDWSGEFGPSSLPALQRIRNLWVDLEPLVRSTGYDDVVDPKAVRIELTDGIGDAESARFDVQWSRRRMYSFHYSDDVGTNWRFDRHPNPHSPEKHFHPPPDASTADAERSCIDVEEVSLVTRAVHAMWRAAHEARDLEYLNIASNPP